MRSKRFLASRKRHTRGHRSNRCGAAVVEFAAIAPLMFLLTLGLVEFGRMTMVKNLAIQASRDGARMAVLPDADSAAVVDAVTEQLEGVGVTVGSVEVSPAQLNTAGPGSPVTVTVTVRPADNSWLPKVHFVTQESIVAATTMRRENV